MSAWVLMAWFEVHHLSTSPVYRPSAPARVEAYDTEEACNTAGKQWTENIHKMMDAAHRKNVGQWTCLPGKKRDNDGDTAGEER